jgi:hypothetical protein
VRPGRLASVALVVTAIDVLLALAVIGAAVVFL